MGIMLNKSRKSLLYKHLQLVRLAGNLTEIEAKLSEWQSLVR